MTWTKIDDRFHDHPKVQRAWHTCPSSIGLHVFAMSHSAAHLTDGHVSPEFVMTCIPGVAGRKRAVAALVDAGLWEVDGPGWQIHDYLDHNPSREQVQAERDQRSEARAGAGRKGARTRWQPPSTTNGKQASSPYGKQAKNASTTNGKQIAPGGDGKPMAPYPYPFPNPLSP